MILRIITKLICIAVVTTLCTALDGQTLNILHIFEQNELGYAPQAGVIAGPTGELYGTTPMGGVDGMGVVFELIPPISPEGAWTEVVLHSFGPQGGDGEPSGPVILGPSGLLYGLTNFTAYQLRPPSGSATRWRESVIDVFTGPNGDNALGGLSFGPHGSIYGATFGGGSAPYPNGVVYRLDPPISRGGPWGQTVLYAFEVYLGDGANPVGSLAVASNGTIYGATQNGGAYDGGTVFALSPPRTEGGTWTESIPYSFGAQTGDAHLPNGVAIGADGVIYGTAMGGDTHSCYNGCGTVFQLSPPAKPDQAWTESILHTFGGDPANDGTSPNSNLVIGPNGVLYGTTSSGGGLVGQIGGAGTIFEMVPPSSPGENWTEVILHVFTGGKDGNDPSGVTLGQDGNLYGTTASGGHHHGTVFQLTLQ